MLKKEVPQDQEVLDGVSEVFYAVDENGRYVLAPSTGWEPANLANLQAWDAIRDELTGMVARIRANRLSPLAYHMAANQMDAKLLASYVGLFVWQVRRHLKPGPFSRLKPEMKKRYAEALLVTAAELEQLPADLSPTMLRIRKNRPAGKA
ncbi:MAG: hypothetical protein HGA76_04795 [Candidatus Firestonebacteria bacterium]|nr:hypothetical protein [Candidatus Firestonebacteria bacterium]